MAPVRFALFGRLTVDADGQERRLKPITAAVLARLLLAKGGLVSAAELCAAMWPGWAGPARREDRVCVQKRVWELRRLLDPHHPGEKSTVLLTDRGASTAYRLVVDRRHVDIFCFEDLVGHARSVPPVRATELLRQALALWTDRPLLDFEGHDFASGVIQQLRLKRDLARRELACAYRDTGRPAEALAVLDALLADHLNDPVLHQLAEHLSREARRRRGSATAVEAAIARVSAVTDPFGRTPVPRQLPSAVRGFTARRQELASLNGLLARAGPGQPAALISALSGMAGVGKTALVVYWAHQVADWFADGQLFVNLRGFDPDAQAMSSGEAVRGFLDALGVSPRGIPASAAAQVNLYRSLLAGRQVLVVLDNARDADQVRPLLPGSPGCLAVVTSRDQLASLVASEGAQLLTLGVLTTAEARQLLASRLGPDRVASEPRAIDDIIARCAGLPLALAIAAARAVVHPRFPLAAIAREPSWASGVLGALDPLDPAAGVHAVSSWSYRQLAPDAARLFRLIGLHPGPDLSVPAAGSLAGIPRSTVRQLLAALARVNLLTEHLPGRYTVHDLLRNYAADLANVHDPATSQRAALHRIFDHYLHTARSAALLLVPEWHSVACGPPHPAVRPEGLTDHREALTWLITEHTVLLAAVEHAARMRFDAHAWQLAVALAEFFDRHGHWEDWVATHRTALDSASRLADRAGQAHVHRGLGIALGRLGHPSDARRHLRRAQRLFRQLGDRVGQAWTHRGLSWIAQIEGRHVEALGHAWHCLDLCRAAGYPAGEAWALGEVGWFHALLGNYDQAVTVCQEAIARLAAAGNGRDEAHTWDNLGYAYRGLGRHAHAVACYAHAAELCADTGARYDRAGALVGLGSAHGTAGDAAAARDAWREALAILDELGHPDADQVRALLGDPGTARSHGRGRRQDRGS